MLIGYARVSNDDEQSNALQLRVLNAAGCARNALARALFFNRLGEMRDRTFENPIYRASGVNLLVSAVILWRTRYDEALIADLAERGRPMPGRS
jgi:TnpA family transposase